jgi:hypothetical protein
MATAISQKTLATADPAVYGEVTYTSSRSGNNMVYNITVSAWITNGGGWRNNRWACKLWVNGKEIWGNTTLKGQTSGAIGTGKYSASVEVKVAINSGSVPIAVQFADTGWSTSWTINEGWGYYEGSLAVTAPSAPSAPSSLSIPSSAAPDQSIAISWHAASGGSNGVSGYQLAYSKDGGSNYSNIDVTGTSKSLDLNSLGFIHGSVLKCAIRSYSTVNGTRYYSAWTYSGSITTSFVAPSVPSTISIPASIAPDKTASISWAAASGGTNGVKGYEWQWSNDGGNTWPGSTQTTETSGSLNLNSNGFKHGSKLMARVRSYTIGQEDKYYSDWKTSTATTTNFVAPSAPQNAKISTDMSEPIPTGTYKAAYSAPANTGSNGISGYRVQWLKNGANYGSEYDVNETSASKETTEDTIQPGDTISFKVRAYTIGQNTRYYSGYTTSGTITIVSDKFIYISQNGASFNKYKAFISVNGGSFTEIKKERLKVIK